MLMTAIDRDMLECVVRRTTAQLPPTPTRIRRAEPSAAQRAQLEHQLRRYARGAGFPLAEWERLAAERRAEQRTLLQTFDADGIVDARRDEAQRVEALDSWREAQRLLPPEAQAATITLDQPFAVSLLTHAQPVNFSSHIEPLNSFARLSIDTHHGSDTVLAIFFFLWQNPSDAIAVINALTMLRFNGVCVVEADTGFFSGHRNVLDVRAILGLFRWSGWGTDGNGNPLDGTPLPVFTGNTSQQVTFLQANGGGLFDVPDLVGDTLRGRPIGLDAESIVVPGGASVLFQVQVVTSYAIEDGGDFDIVQVHFGNDDLVQRITCPFLRIELLT